LLWAGTVRCGAALLRVCSLCAFIVIFRACVPLRVFVRVWVCLCARVRWSALCVHVCESAVLSAVYVGV
jgi:hypothetical protein